MGSKLDISKVCKINLNVFWHFESHSLNGACDKWNLYENVFWNVVFENTFLYKYYLFDLKVNSYFIIS